MAITADHQGRWEQLLEADRHRNEFVAVGDVDGGYGQANSPQTLLKDLNTTKSKLATAELEVERESSSARQWQISCKDAELGLQRQQAELNSNAFILVLIDGDCMNFVDSLVQNKELGGQEAARKLRDCTLEYVHRAFPDLSRDLRVQLKVYCNLKGISKTCVDARVLNDSEEFVRFVRGFNMGDPLCDFVDAGSGKECSDDKLRENFKLQIGLAQCKHIIFGGSADNGYARLLGPFCGNIIARGRITLLEGPPFAGELSQMLDKFHTASFPTVFRTTKLPNRKVSFSSTPPKSVSPKPQTYAARVRSQPAEFPIESTREVISHEPAPEDNIPRNSRGDRIDIPISASQLLIIAMKKKKLCNPHHLTGFCPFQGCVHGHNERLDDKHMAALRVVARLAPCSRGLGCDDEQCFYGHQCSLDYCRGKNDCKFPPAMHDVDRRLVSR